MAIVFSIALLFFSHILINTYTIQIIENVGGSSSDMGIATAIAGFVELPAMAFFPLLFRRIQSARLKFRGTPLLICSMDMEVISDNWVL